MLHLYQAVRTSAYYKCIVNDVMLQHCIYVRAQEFLGRRLPFPVGVVAALTTQAVCTEKLSGSSAVDSSLGRASVSAAANALLRRHWFEPVP